MYLTGGGINDMDNLIIAVFFGVLLAFVGLMCYFALGWSWF
jgi:hypothetical protein